MTPTQKFTPEQIKTLIAGIAQSLGVVPPPYDKDNWAHRIALPDEAGIYISYNGYKHRVHISGIWPTSRLAGESHKTFTPSDVYPHPADTSISISAAKSPAQIATEILRRFLPAYRVVLAQCLVVRERHETFVKTQNSVADRIAASLGVPRPAGHDNQPGTSFDLPKSLTAPEHSPYGSISVSGETVRFAINSVPAAQALKLVEFLKTL